MNQTKSDKFNILLTNDDGFNADGFNALFDVFNTPQNQQKYNVVAVAPNSNRSGIGTALTLISPIEINKIKNNFYSLDANPVDCVITAMNGILQQFDGTQFLPDLVISGINNGSNFSQTIWSSGTVSAAVYASQVYQIPALAVSLAYDVERFFAKEFNYEEKYESPNYQQAAQVILNIVENITLQKQKQNQKQNQNKNQNQQNFLLNINIPNQINQNSKIKFCDFIKLDAFERSKILATNSTRKSNLFWLPNIRLNREILLKNSQNSDIVAVLQNNIAITPLFDKYDFDSDSDSNSNSNSFKYLENIEIKI